MRVRQCKSKLLFDVAVKEVGGAHRDVESPPLCKIWNRLQRRRRIPVIDLSRGICDTDIVTSWMAQGISVNGNELKGFMQLRSTSSSSAVLQPVYCELTARRLEVFYFC